MKAIRMLRDLLSEALAGLFARPGRSLLTVLGTVLGIGALVATLGVAETAGNQIVGTFNELSATSVVVSTESGFFGGGGPRVALPWGSMGSLRRARLPKCRSDVTWHARFRSTIRSVRPSFRFRCWPFPQGSSRLPARHS